MIWCPPCVSDRFGSEVIQSVCKYRRQSLPLRTLPSLQTWAQQLNWKYLTLILDKFKKKIKLLKQSLTIFDVFKFGKYWRKRLQNCLRAIKDRGEKEKISNNARFRSNIKRTCNELMYSNYIFTHTHIYLGQCYIYDLCDICDLSGSVLDKFITNLNGLNLGWEFVPRQILIDP